MGIDVKKNHELLIKTLEKVKLDRESLRKELEQNYSDELLDKIVNINKIIKNAEFLVNCTAEEAINKFKENFPSQIDKNGQLTEKGIKRLKLLNDKFNPLK